jgi:hypothetical protein
MIEYATNVFAIKVWCKEKNRLQLTLNERQAEEMSRTQRDPSPPV